MSKQGVLANESAQGRLREQGKDREQILDAAINGIMSSPDGRLAMHYIVYTLMGLESVCLDSDPRVAALWEGRRWGAKMLRELLERASPDMVETMMAEAQRLKKAGNQAAKAAVLEDADGE